MLYSPIDIFFYSSDWCHYFPDLCKPQIRRIRRIEIDSSIVTIDSIVPIDVNVWAIPVKTTAPIDPIETIDTIGEKNQFSRLVT